jgi:hypothetical protein
MLGLKPNIFGTFYNGMNAVASDKNLLSKTFQKFEPFEKLRKISS